MALGEPAEDDIPFRAKANHAHRLQAGSLVRIHCEFAARLFKSIRETLKVLFFEAAVAHVMRRSMARLLKYTFKGRHLARARTSANHFRCFAIMPSGHIRKSWEDALPKASVESGQTAIFCP
jgi:hypothetical protein